MGFSRDGCRYYDYLKVAPVTFSRGRKVQATQNPSLSYYRINCCVVVTPMTSSFFNLSLIFYLQSVFFFNHAREAMRTSGMVLGVLTTR